MLGVCGSAGESLHSRSLPRAGMRAVMQFTVLEARLLDLMACGGCWCPGEDSNLHELLHWYLKPARLPVPPPGQEGAVECEAQESTHPRNPCQFGGLEWSIAASHGKMLGSPSMKPSPTTPASAAQRADRSSPYHQGISGPSPVARRADDDRPRWTYS